jgi:hypothetical protein
VTDRPRGIRSPLTFGQLSVLRALQQLPVDRWSETYLSVPVPLPAGTGTAEVTEAVRVLQARHDSLRTHFVDSLATDGAPEGTVALTMPATTPDVSVADVAEPTPDSAVSAAHDLCRQRFRWTEEFAWRPVMVLEGARPAYLVVVVDHIVADGWGLRRLGGELRAMLRGDDEAGAGWLAETPCQPGELALAQRSATWRPRRVAADRYWDQLLDELPPETFPWPVPPPGAGRIEAMLRSPRARHALGGAAHQLGTSPQSVLLALTGIAAACVFDQEDVVLTLQASNRYDRRWRHLVSSMNQAAPVPIAGGRATGEFAAYAQQVHWGGLNAYRHGSYHFDGMVQKVRKARDLPLEFDLFFNFMAHDVAPSDAPPAADAPPAEVRVTRPRRQVGPRFDVKIRDSADMPILVRADPALIGQDELNRLLHWFDEELARLAGPGPVRVDDSRRRCEEVVRA